MAAKTGNPCEREHDFVLILDGVTALSEDMENALFDAGCDDATLALRFGRTYMTFTRSAPTLREAVVSAIRDVQKAKVGATVLRVDDGSLVTQAEIARKIGRSRQLVHQYVNGSRGPGNFPAPCCQITDEAPLWRWSEVADWLHRGNFIKAEVLQDAREVAVINSVLDLVHQQDLDPGLAREVLQLVAGDRAARPTSAS